MILVVIAGHIPPGLAGFFSTSTVVTVSWHRQYVHRYHKIIAKYMDVIIVQTYGHYHIDSFRMESVLENQPHSPPPLLIAPSVSPIFATNPSWRYLIFKNTTMLGHNKIILKDYYQYFMPLSTFDNLGTYSLYPNFEWLLEYQFTTLYGVPDASPASYQEVMHKLKNNSTLFSKFENYKLAQGDRHLPPFLQLCLMSSIDYKEIQRCLADKLTENTHLINN